MIIFKDEEVKPQKDYVYIIADQHNYIKVGISKNPNKRIKSLQTGHPDTLKLIFTEEFECTRKHLLNIEKLIHRDLRLKNYKKRGEWFNVPETDLEDIKSIIRYNRIRYEDNELYFKYMYKI